MSWKSDEMSLVFFEQVREEIIMTSILQYDQPQNALKIPVEERESIIKAVQGQDKRTVPLS